MKNHKLCFSEIVKFCIYFIYLLQFRFIKTFIYGNIISNYISLEPEILEKKPFNQ